MIKCSKCKSDDYDVLYIEDYEYHADEIIVLVKARCCNCDKEFWVKETFLYSEAENVL